MTAKITNALPFLLPLWHFALAYKWLFIPALALILLFVFFLFWTRKKSVASSQIYTLS